MDQEVLLKILSLRIKDSITFDLLKEVIGSYSSTRGVPFSAADVPLGRHADSLAKRQADSTVTGGKVGMPIGNLTSQIFANVYLNELDRFVKHELKISAYLRYGDDFIVLENYLERLREVRVAVSYFLTEVLKLQVNPKSDKIMKVTQGLKFLGVKLWPSGRTLNRRNLARRNARLGPVNVSSYRGLVKKHGNGKQMRHFSWMVSSLYDAIE